MLFLPPTKMFPFASSAREKKFGVLSLPARMISDTSTGIVGVWAHALPATASSAATRRAAKILGVLSDTLVTVVPLSRSTIGKAKN